MGNITDILDAVDVDRTAHYDYDSLDRLVGADGWWGRLDWSYDHTGNRLSENRLDPGATDAAVSSYAYQGGTSRLLTVTGVGSSAIEHALEYDSSGNATRYDDLLLEYDSADRLIRINERPSGATVQDDAYDWKLRRAKRIEYLDTDGDTVRETTECTQFLYDILFRLIAEHDCGTGAVLAEYVYAEGYRVLAARRGGAWFWYLSDHLPTPRKLVDASRTVVWDGRMEPFGTTDEVVAAVEQRLRFPGQHEDDAVPLVQNFHRWFLPELGRYAATDTIPRQIPPVFRSVCATRHANALARFLARLQSGSDVYGYAAASPLRFRDPSGRQTEWDDAEAFGMALEDLGDLLVDLWNAPGPLTPLCGPQLEFLSCVLEDIGSTGRAAVAMDECIAICPPALFIMRFGACLAGCFVQEYGESIVSCM